MRPRGEMLFAQGILFLNRRKGLPILMLSWRRLICYRMLAPVAVQVFRLESFDRCGSPHLLQKCCRSWRRFTSTIFLLRRVVCGVF